MNAAAHSGEEMPTANAEPLRPVMIHRALLGSIERFTAIATEHFRREMVGIYTSDPSHDTEQPDQAILAVPATSARYSCLETLRMVTSQS
jgi:hypothetical protein